MNSQLRSLILKNDISTNVKTLLNYSLRSKMLTSNTKAFKVFVSQPIPQQAVDIFNSNNIELVINDRMPTRQKLLESVADIDGLFCTLNEKVDRELLDAAKKLKVFSNQNKTLEL
jgi:hypothetical protein